VDTFLEYGYDGTTMETVAQAAEITKSTLYSRYPDKRTLFIAVSSWALTRQERDERVLEPLPDDLAEALTVITRAVLARSVDPDIVRLSRMAIAESPRFPEFAANSQAVTWSPRIRVIMDLLRRHESAGTVVVHDVELAAEQFFAMVGAMPAWLAAYGIYRTPEVEEAHLQHAIELFLKGVLVRADPAAAPVGDRREKVLREIVGHYTSARDRADEARSQAQATAVRRLLELGESPEAVAAALGITPARVRDVQSEQAANDQSVSRHARH